MEQQRARIRTIKAHPVREGCYTRRLTPRGIVQRPGICDIKLFNHRTIEKARVSHVVGDSRQGMCVYTYIRVHSCMCIGSRIARKSRPFRVFPLSPLLFPPYDRILWRNDEHAYTPIQHACRGRWVSVRNIQLNRRGIECVGWGVKSGRTSYGGGAREILATPCALSLSGVSNCFLKRLHK